MELLRSRNPQSALPLFLNMLYSKGVNKDGVLTLNQPVTIVYDKPRERLIFWPEFTRNPAQELMVALHGLRQVESVIDNAAKDVVAGKEHFIFSTPQLVIQANVDDKGKMHMRTVVAQSNPFLGAFGHLALQLTILHELMANAVGLEMGTFSIQHMQIAIDANVVERLLKAGLEAGIPEDPYRSDVKTRKIDGSLNMAVLLDEGVAANGYRSKFVRQVILPMFQSARSEGFEPQMNWAKKIKADDWRRAMMDYLSATQNPGADSGAETTH